MPACWPNRSTSPPMPCFREWLAGIKDQRKKTLAQKRAVDPRARQFASSMRIRYHGFAGWSSLVARRAHNPEVVGSNPTPATMGALRRNLEAPFFLSVAHRVLALPFLVYCRSLVPIFN